ncbi:cell division protein ZipA C-terminal FtsZ-binding domain-containing protein [Halomonas alkaliantarctica]|uniref:cell division protein ZipA C-terminal FtsZ-binding domain-containing protein n=1 Tax=Halomonas alkaliantarctica TaxID=232346 RepID=UPI0004AA5FF6|nr:cell division protein ZipA C-terminal FtsZ-binding domain-containing protein [Halomonas alkaliantarctica]
MELREWLIILGLALVSLIVVDGVRRLQRQRRVPRLDQAVNDLPAAKIEEFNDEIKEAEINWELPNGGARVIKPADYSNLGQKPKLERQEHPGPSRVLSDFRRSFSNSASSAKSKANAHFSWSRKNEPRKNEPLKHEQPSTVGHSTSAKHSSVQLDNASVEHTLGLSAVAEPERREPSVFMADETPNVNVEPQKAHTSAFTDASNSDSSGSGISSADNVSSADNDNSETQPISERAENSPLDAGDQVANAEKKQAASPQETVTTDPQMSEETVSEEVNNSSMSSMSAEETAVKTAPTAELSEEQAEPTLRVEPEDAAHHASGVPKRRQLRSDTAGEERELDDDEVDEYRLVDFEGIGRSFKRRLIERRKEKARKKAEKAKRAEALAKQKAERKALEAERKALEAQQRREAKEAADAEKARIAQEQAEAREAAAIAAAAEREAAQHSEPTVSTRDVYDDSYDDSYHDGDNYEVGYDDDAPEIGYRDNVVRTHPTLEKALRHDVNSERARDTLTDAAEMVVISVLSREPEGFDGGKLLELIMACGLRYSREMGVFHRFETESFDSELQFSMVNVLKPGTFPIEEMDEFVTPGITFLMPLPGAEDSSAAFEAMVETAMVVVRHMGGELKDENRSVMTAQTIEFARQRVHEFERRHRLHRQLQAR